MSRRSVLISLLLTALIPIAAILYHRLIILDSLFTSNPSPTAPMASQPLPIIVIGAGLAGLTASLSALRSGANSVILLERAAKPGGNSIKASSGINGAPTRYQKGPEVDTTFYADTIKSAGTRLALSPPEEQVPRTKLIGLLTNSSKAAVEFLTDEIGVDLSVVAQLGGHSVARTHRGGGKTPPGAAIITALLAKLKEEDGRFALRTSCEVTRLLTSDPPTTRDDHHSATIINGVEYVKAGQTLALHGGVIFATGGFAGDAHGLLATYRPDLAGLPSTNDARPGMHSLLAAAGASLVDMDSVQIHPTGFVDPADPAAPLKFLAAEMLRGEGGILLHGGRRFVNEMETRQHVSDVVMRLPPASDAVAGQDGSSGKLRQWDLQLLLDPGACDAAAAHIGFYLWKGLVVKKKVKELDAATRETILDYSVIVAGQRADELGRKAFGHWRLKGTPEDDDEDVCVGRVTPITHFTMGGVVINEKSQVLASNIGESHQLPIEGLWAAGEVTGGIHGDNRLGGSSLLECVVFGLIAGEQAAKYGN